MTLSLLHYSFLDYPLPPKRCSEADESQRSQVGKPLPAEARWLLWQWSQVFGLDQSIACRVQTLCQRLGTTQQQWSRVMGMLKASGVMVTSPVPQQRGRPLTEYRIAAPLRYDLGNLAISGVCHRREIELVLEGRDLLTSVAEVGPPSDGRFANLMSAEARRCRLTPANRWLIAVLLAHAETPGRVTSLSYTRLEYLTGMSRNQLQSQITKLRGLEILAHHQPGRLGYLFGSQMTSIFIFDLDHHLFRPEKCLEVGVTLLSPCSKGQKCRTVVTGLVEALFVVAHVKGQDSKTLRRKYGRLAARQAEKVLLDALTFLPNAFDPGPLASRLAQAYDAHSASWLLTRLQGYAEQLLSHGWDRLSEGQGGVDDPVERVIDRIASDFPEWPEPAGQEDNSKGPPDAAAESKCDTSGSQDAGIMDAGVLYARHVTLFYTLAHHLAVELQHWLITQSDRQGDVCLRELRFSLTPKDLQGYPLLKVQGWSQCSSPVQTPPTAFVTLDSIDSDMANWLGQRRVTGKSCSSNRLSRKRYGRKFRLAFE